MLIICVLLIVLSLIDIALIYFMWSTRKAFKAYSDDNEKMMKMYEESLDRFAEDSDKRLTRLEKESAERKKADPRTRTLEDL